MMKALAGAAAVAALLGLGSTSASAAPVPTPKALTNTNVHPTKVSRLAASTGTQGLIAVIGDSITAGGLIAPWDRLDVQVGQQLDGQQSGQLGHATIVNWGVGGRALLNGPAGGNLADVFPAMVAASPRPDVMVVTIGTNDLFNYAGDVAWTAAMVSMYNQATAAGIRILFGTIPPLGTSQAGRDQLRRTLNTWMLNYLGSAIVIQYDSGLGASPPPGVTNADAAYMLADGIHPNGWGTLRMARAIVAKLVA